MSEKSIHRSDASFESVLENALNALKRMRQENLSLDEYLDDFNAQNGTHIVSVSAPHVEPMGLYGGKQTTLDVLKG